MAVVSPCINTCRMDALSGLCVGCYRNIDEIAAWSRVDDGVRVEILARIEQRRAGVDLTSAALRGTGE
jgi:predicted Fe-S protein YdhL (DUF1289 family)